MLFRLLFPLLIWCLGCSGEKTPGSEVGQHRIERGTQAVPEFDGQIAFEYLRKQVDFGPRVPGTPSHERCLNYLTTEMRRYADAVNHQPFTVKGYDGETFKGINLVASFNLKATTRILLMAHWDTRPWADEEKDTALQHTPVPGANDGASGVAVLLEIARHLREAQPAVGIDIVFTDAEDYGRHNDPEGFLHGARHFAKQLPIGYQPVFGILLDMVGDRELELLKEPNSVQFAPDIVDLVWKTAARLGIGQFVNREQTPVTDDHLPLNYAGIRTIDIIDFDYPDASNRYWHTLADTPDKCSPESLQAVGTVVMHVVYEYGGG